MTHRRTAFPSRKENDMQKLLHVADVAMDYTLFVAILGGGVFLLQQAWG